MFNCHIRWGWRALVPAECLRSGAGVAGLIAEAETDTAYCPNPATLNLNGLVSRIYQRFPTPSGCFFAKSDQFRYSDNVLTQWKATAAQQLDRFN
jgi:hypothetical protein